MNAIAMININIDEDQGQADWLRKRKKADSPPDDKGDSPPEPTSPEAA